MGSGGPERAEGGKADCYKGDAGFEHAPVEVGC